MNSSSQQRGWGAGRRAIFPVLALVAVLAMPSAALAASFKLTPHITNHTPTINKNWPVIVDVTRGKVKLSGSVKYQFLFGGAVVSTQKGHTFKNGVYRDNMIFPSSSLGEPLTLRIVVKTKYGTEHLDWKVTAQR
jgi:hypothetical protein